MPWYLNMPLKAKLLVAFGIVAAFAAFTGLVGYLSVEKVYGAGSNISDVQMPGAIAAMKLQIEMREVARDVRTGLVDVEDKTGWQAKFDESFAGSKKALEEVEPHFVNTEGKKLVAEAKAAFAEWATLTEKTHELT